MRDCGHPVLIGPHVVPGDVRRCPRCEREVRFGGASWRLNTTVVEVERELIQAVHNEIIDDSTFNEALRTILVERGAIQSLEGGQDA